MRELRFLRTYFAICFGATNEMHGFYLLIYLFIYLFNYAISIS